MDQKKRKSQIDDSVVAPGAPEDALDKKATQAEIENGESTKVTRLMYDEYDPSER
ncbi:hypothetical protein [Virgibacillus phasianinus]|uniref:hypothetical protein n=1 Tax=Virgibacillus phasianinus TaxID=2017483 RepID=UPI00155FE77D|nr:hypothetical protein [Virgibacillus phasianinus]